MTRTLWSALILIAVLTSACSPQKDGASGVQPSSPARSQLLPSRTLQIAIYAEPGTLAQKALGAGPGTSFDTTLRAFNATLGMIDGQGEPRPYLAEGLPQLDTETWRLFPDGRMETTYRLRANLSWHDGSPLSAEDFVFAWQVYTSPRVGIAAGAPQNLITEVVAPEPGTLVIHWKSPYPDAGVLAGDTFPPLPRHLLETPFREDPAGLERQPSWTREYVGAGPYKLTRWEPGAFIEGDAFENHGLGKPRIDRIRFTFMGDANAAVAGLLAGTIDVATDIAIRFEQALILEQEWAVQKRGAIIFRTGSFHGAYPQLRPDLVNPGALLDVRVRRALAHTLSREDINDVLFDGRGVMSEVPKIPPGSSYYAEAERAIVKYPYDIRMSEQLMADAGFRKAGDGIYTSGTDERMHTELKTLVSAQRQKEQAILTAGWRKVGFEFSEAVLPAAQAVDSEQRATFSGLFTFTQAPGEYALAHEFSTAAIGSPQNRWVGNNRGAWSNQEFDGLAAAFTSAVAPPERVRYVAQMARVITEHVPVIPISFSLGVEAHVGTLNGPKTVARESQFAWNIHAWELR